MPNIMIGFAAFLLAASPISAQDWRATIHATGDVNLKGNEPEFLARLLLSMNPVQKRRVASPMARTTVATMNEGEKLKRPKNAYMFYTDDRRKAVSATLPGSSVGEVAKKLGAEWRAMSENDKAPYAAKAAADKKRYEDAIAAGATPPEQKSRKKKAKTASTGPKKISAYLHYVKARMQPARAELMKSMGADFKQSEVMKAIGAEWRSLDAKSKSHYEELAKVPVAA
jgi:hypothetical protein